jgi:hypothetical protein
MKGISGTLAEQGSGIRRALVSGEITPDHGVKLLQALQSLASADAASELEKRIAALESAVLQKSS